jgi:hypothetical protein
VSFSSVCRVRRAPLKARTSLQGCWRAAGTLRCRGAWQACGVSSHAAASPCCPQTGAPPCSSCSRTPGICDARGRHKRAMQEGGREHCAAPLVSPWAERAGLRRQRPPSPKLCICGPPSRCAVGISLGRPHLGVGAAAQYVSHRSRGGTEVRGRVPPRLRAIAHARACASTCSRAHGCVGARAQRCCVPRPVVREPPGEPLTCMPVALATAASCSCEAHADGQHDTWGSGHPSVTCLRRSAPTSQTLQPTPIPRGELEQLLLAHCCSLLAHCCSHTQAEGAATPRRLVTINIGVKHSHHVTTVT